MQQRRVEELVVGSNLLAQWSVTYEYLKCLDSNDFASHPSNVTRFSEDRRKSMQLGHTDEKVMTGPLKALAYFYEA